MTDFFMKAEGGRYGLDIGELAGKQVGDEAMDKIRSSIGLLVGLCITQKTESAKITHKGVKINGEDGGDWEIIIRKIN